MAILRGITRNVVVLGFVSFFTDLASEMLYPIIPLFITGTLGLDKQWLGVIEGVAEGISTGLRWIGGVLSDLARKRKPFVWWGYTISALSKPVMGLAAVMGGWPLFLAGRASDRFGKSIRTAARDALIADATAPEHRGAAFGFHRMMDTCGAILGPLVALAVLYFRPATPLYWLFFLALVPGLMSSLLVALFVQDSPHAPDANAARTKARFWQHYPAAFWHLIAANAIFSLGNSSDSFLILRATEMHFGANSVASATMGMADLTRQAMFATTLFAAFNVVYAVLATPAGMLSDRLSRKSVITLGWLVYAAVYAGFGLAGATAASWTPWLLFATYGIYQAFTEGVTKAYVSDLVPAGQRAGAIGLYYTVAGLCQLGASLLAGWLWSHVGAAPAFLAGTFFSLLAIPVLLTIPSKRSEGAVEN